MTQAAVTGPSAPTNIDCSSRQRSVYWDINQQALMMIDQRNLPHSYSYVPHTTVSQVAESIATMLVRGAPAIGTAGAFGIALAAQNCKQQETMMEELKQAKQELDAARPTAVNLEWATARMLELAQLLSSHSIPLKQWPSLLLTEAQQLADDDVSINRRLGEFGNSLIPQRVSIIHHCNTGCLATVDFGTALGVIYAAHHSGKQVSVYVDETRPRLQGAKLTCWELMREGVPLQLIVDGASGSLMSAGKVDVVLFGADRVAANGDVANKIGTYNLACAAHYNKVPVYACVPCSTIDLSTPTGARIKIESRSSEEVTDIGSTVIAPLKCPVYNPAFDVTPNQFLTAIITEEGICYPPFEKSLSEAKQKSEARVREKWMKRLKEYLKQ